MATESEKPTPANPASDKEQNGEGANSKKERDQTTANTAPPKTEPQASSALDPRDLLASANEASGTARNSWLAFLGLLTYLLVTLSGITHVDLLLNSPVVLPIAQVEIPLFSFFLAAPFLFLLVHLGLLVQHAMLAHQYQHFSLAIGQSEEEQAGDHPARKLVHNYVFSQMLAGSRPPWPLHMLMRLMVFVTLSLLPLLVLLYFQIKFLPSHDVAITHAHRLALLLDLAVLIIVRPFIAMPFLRPHGKRLSLGNQSWRWDISYVSLGIAGLLGFVVVSFSLLVATVPQACFRPWVKQTEEKECFSLDRTTAQWWPSKVTIYGHRTREVFVPTSWLFEGKPDPISGTLSSLFSRNLIVTDKVLVEKKDLEKGDKSLSLRGRDLRFAVLDRSDLRNADLIGSDLRSASARDSRLDHTDLQGAQLQEALLSGAQLQGANLGNAKLQGASLKNAQLQGANLTGAQLQGAYLVKAQLQGANLGKAKLQGAELFGVQLQGANLSEAHLQGSNLKNAQLQGVNFDKAQLQGASLERANLQGASFGMAKLQGTNLSRARIWQTWLDPSFRQGILMEEMYIGPLEPEEKRGLEKLIAEGKDETQKNRLRIALGALLDNSKAQNWENTPSYKSLSAFLSRSMPDDVEHSSSLAKLACRDTPAGYVINGIAFSLISARGWFPYVRLTAGKLLNKETCPASKYLSEKMRVELQNVSR